MFQRDTEVQAADRSLSSPPPVRAVPPADVQCSECLHLFRDCRQAEVRVRQ